MKLWIATSYTPHGNKGDAFAIVMAETEDEARTKMAEAISEHRSNYVPSQQRLDGIEIDRLRELEGGAFVTDGLR
jgi:hypothetical protein